ncbi:MAG: cyclopropane fatty acyl phospholipid synthase [Halioglobus sp.]|nr:cyclopropane fatty acyl phospholipid synthase [Halioglobus sp.]
MRLLRSSAESAFARAGVSLDGSRPWDITVRDERFFRHVVMNGSLGLGESYMRRYWCADDLEELFRRLVASGLDTTAQRSPQQLFSRLFSRISNQQTQRKSKHNAEHHYNLGNDLFFEFLGRYKNYSCGYFRQAQTLDEAQLAKMQRLCELLQLTEGDRLLDVGGGWGEFARFAATRYGCHVTSINIADEQIAHARQYCRGTNVDIVKCDYRDLSGSYNKIAVIAMFTHVGHRNYRRFMQIMHRLLGSGGKMVMETVGGLTSKSCCEPWTNRYIFPGGMIPSMAQIDAAIDGLFSRDAVEEFGQDYAVTLRQWHHNFMAAWPKLSHRYSDSMRLMFEYFFLSVAGAFRANGLLHYHIEFSRLPGRG